MNIKIAVGLIASAAVCFFLTSCGASEQKPDYLLEGARDNGFVAAYRAYTSITGDSVKKISGSKYEKLTLGEGSEYSCVAYELFSFDAKAESTYPATWEIEQNPYDDKERDMEAIFGEIKQMALSYTGNVYIVVTEFDDLRIIQVTSLGDDGSTISDTSFGLFRNGQPVELPKNVKLDDIRSVYKYDPQKGKG